MKVVFTTVLLAVMASAAFLNGQQASEAAATIPASDWPQWRGPHGDGVTPETTWNPRALEGGTRVLWTALVGTGYSNIAIANGRLYATGTRRDHLVFTCLDAATGSVIWQQAAVEDLSDPMSTPTVNNGRVYGISKSGTVTCLDAADGHIVWQASVPYKPYYFGWATSPVVEGNVVLVNAGLAGMAFDKATGKIAWQSEAFNRGGDQFAASYATPVLLDLEGARAALFLGPTQLSAVEAATGKVFWSVADAGGEQITDPVVWQNLVLMLGPFSGPAAVLQVSQNKAAILWSSTTVDINLHGGISTPVILDGYVYGVDHDVSISNWNWNAVKAREWPLRCVNLKTGKQAWMKPVPYLQITAANGRLITLDLNGTLTVASASPQGFQAISSGDIFAGAKRPRLFATPPVLFDGRIYARNYAGDLVCIDVRK